MKFLIDAQLPPSLAPLLTSLGHEARHVADLGLASAPDAEIWAHAESSGAAILPEVMEAWEAGERLVEVR